MSKRTKDRLVGGLFAVSGIAFGVCAVLCAVEGSRVVAVVCIVAALASVGASLLWAWFPDSVTP